MKSIVDLYRTKPPPKSRQVAVYLDDDLYVTLEEFCKYHQLSKAEFFRMASQFFIDTMKNDRPPNES